MVLTHSKKKLNCTGPGLDVLRKETILENVHGLNGLIGCLGSSWGPLKCFEKEGFLGPGGAGVGSEGWVRILGLLHVLAYLHKYIDAPFWDNILPSAFQYICFLYIPSDILSYPIILRDLSHNNEVIKEKCFFEGVEAGKLHTVECWINKTTMARTSD